MGFVSLLGATHRALSPRTLYVTSHGRNPNARLSALTRDAQPLTALNVSQFASSHTASPTARPLSPSARPSAKSPDATGSAASLTAPSLNVSWSARILHALLRLSAATATE